MGFFLRFDLSNSLLKLVQVFMIHLYIYIQGGSNMTGTDLCVNKPLCAAAVRP